MTETTIAPIFSAINDNNHEALTVAIEADPTALGETDASGATPILAALYRGRRDLLPTLVRARGDLDIFEAAATGDTQRVADLLGGRPDLAQAYSGDGFTALQLASFFGNIEAARILLDRGAEVDAVANNPMKIAAIHAAAANNHPEIIKLLVEHRANINAKQEGGWTALHEAAHHGRTDTVTLLLDAGADVLIAADNGQTAADKAREAGYVDERL